jgi:SAM-dependent methyltransferase
MASFTCSLDLGSFDAGESDDEDDEEYDSDEGSESSDDEGFSFGTQEVREADNETLEREYWDEYFDDADPAEPTEWLLSFASFGRFMTPFIPNKDDDILVVGCGNTTFSSDLYAAGYTNLRCSDISPVVVGQMAEQHAALTTVQWEVQDARKLTYAKNSCDTVVDKSLLDCMMYAADFKPSVTKLVSELHRVLKPGGTCVFLTMRGPKDVESIIIGPASEWASVQVVPLSAGCNSQGCVSPRSLCVLQSQEAEAFPKDLSEEVGDPGHAPNTRSTKQHDRRHTTHETQTHSSQLWCSLLLPTCITSRRPSFINTPGLPCPPPPPPPPRTGQHP